MTNEEYMTLRKKFWSSQQKAADEIGGSIWAVHSREVGRVRVTHSAEIALLRAIAGRLLGKKLSAPVIAPKPWRQGVRLGAAKTAPNKAVRGSTAKAVAAFVGAAPPPKVAQPVVCAAPGCTRPVEALPGARLCPQHGMEAGWIGLKRFA